VRVVNPSHDDPTIVELNFMWLPTFIGQNPVVLKDLRKELEGKFVKKQITEETLWAMHHTIIRWLEAKFPFDGIGKYLHAIEEVKDDQ
jgi:hypothetical protein